MSFVVHLEAMQRLNELLSDLSAREAWFGALASVAAVAVVTGAIIAVAVASMATFDFMFLAVAIQGSPFCH